MSPVHAYTAYRMLMMASRVMEIIMTVYILESTYFGLFEVWESYEAVKAHVELNPEISVRPYGEGWNLYIPGRHSPVGLIRPHKVRK